MIRPPPTSPLFPSTPLSRPPAVSKVSCAALRPSSGNSVMRCCSTTCLSVDRSEEHTSELQSQSNLVCRLLLEKKKATAATLLVGFLSAAESRQRSCFYTHRT